VQPLGPRNIGRLAARVASPSLCADCICFICFHSVRPDDLPFGELRSLFVGIGDGLTREDPVGNEGRLAATLRKMSDEKAYQLIERIMEFNRKLRGLVVIGRAFVDPGSASVH
jgi:hypothetical protein